MKTLLHALALALFLHVPAWGADDPKAVVVIANGSVGHVDTPTLQRLYMGRAVEVNGVPVVPANLAPNNPLRQRFFAEVLNQTEDKYAAYWTVRRHIGKGIPPREVQTVAEMIDYVQNTPGALGYIAASDLKAGLNVVARP